MSITIFDKEYDINISELYLIYNHLTVLPDSIGNLVNLKQLYLYNNKLTSLPLSILKIKEKLFINETSYEINNLSMESKILIFKKLNVPLTNLPILLKEIWLLDNIVNFNIKLPFDCKIKKFSLSNSNKNDFNKKLIYDSLFYTGLGHF